MSVRLPITEPELLQRLAMDQAEFERFVDALTAQVPPRAFDAAVYERAIGYPWERPPGSYRLVDGRVELLADLPADRRSAVVARHCSAASGRVPVVAIGSNAAPVALERKFAHFPDPEDRTVVALTGRLHDFDIGVGAHPTLYGALPATLFPSPGTAVCATVVWATPAQFTQLAWSELTYRLGRLRTRFELDDDGAGFDEVLVFVSRFGAFCVDERPVALAAIPASGRTAVARSQEELLAAAATLAIGPDATAEALVRAVFEDMAGLRPRLATTVCRRCLPFASERWTPYGVDSSGAGASVAAR